MSHCTGGSTSLGASRDVRRRRTLRRSCRIARANGIYRDCTIHNHLIGGFWFKGDIKEKARVPSLRRVLENNVLSGKRPQEMQRVCRELIGSHIQPIREGAELLGHKLHLCKLIYWGQIKLQRIQAFQFRAYQSYIIIHPTMEPGLLFGRRRWFRWRVEAVFPSFRGRERLRRRGNDSTKRHPSSILGRRYSGRKRNVEYG